jgi:poly(3-hydroxybutyrate) depolymerase
VRIAKAIGALCMALGLLAAGAASAQSARRPAPIPAPKPVGCVTEVTAGDTKFACDGITYFVAVDPKCLKEACGLIFDIHGASMSATQQRQNTELDKLGPPKGYLVVQPSAAPEGPGTWNFETSPPKVAAFMDQMIQAFHVDRARVHVTGFSMGAGMTFWFLCNHPDKLASVAVVTGSSADQVKAPTGGGKCIDALNADWKPRVPILFMNGIKDVALTEAAAQARTDGIVSRLALSGGQRIAGDDHWQRRHWSGAGGMEFDFVTHDYSAGERLGGHCMPGGKTVNATTCTLGDIKLHWGQLALDWFIAHPKP